MIAWGSLAIEFVVSLVAAGGAVAIYAIGIRLLAVGAPAPASAAVGGPHDGADAGRGVTAPGSRPAGATVGAWLCFAIDIAAVLFGLYLIIPQLHH